MSMNRIFQPTANALLFRLSDGAERYKSRDGRFKVVYQKKKEKIFSTLLEAFLFYITLDEEAALFDVSKSTTLIERKIMLCMN
ncbi:hypothetical protein GCM10023229_02570 [Flavisolibacter ginsenosidimutans]